MVVVDKVEVLGVRHVGPGLRQALLRLELHLEGIGGSDGLPVTHGRGGGRQQEGEDHPEQGDWQERQVAGGKVRSPQDHGHFQWSLVTGRGADCEWRRLAESRPFKHFIFMWLGSE